MSNQYITKDVCPKIISFDLENNVVHNVAFIGGGCNGNLKAICKIVEGMTVEEIEENFKGINCNSKGTSCTDQLATAVSEVYNNVK
ncbi:TIGR03905 family TSCPD domain-containing protein [Clostridium diolis]|uniref:ribonucleoside-diphosphate reductase n=1 Tax=Clostridium diolis TaxID=223919 RepID=A0AAV3W5W1_9CLOT|nr:TIGR03905 family TSCPD domain-containing protein [Clostridium diolis]QES73390.1 TIGR03905 family TSCPD domain-containing protein [Clostridium diolis]GEA33708.1 TSCPD domain-containing protein [Clostridium diolis]